MHDQIPFFLALRSLVPLFQIPFEGLSFVMMLGVELRKLMLAYEETLLFLLWQPPVIINDDHFLIQAYNHTSLTLNIMDIFEIPL